MRKRLCRILKPEQIDRSSLKLRKTKRGDSILTGMLLGQEAETAVAIQFADAVGEEQASSVCRSFSGELFDSQLEAFGFTELGIPVEVVDDAEFERIAGFSVKEDGEPKRGTARFSSWQSDHGKYGAIIARAGETINMEGNVMLSFTTDVLKTAVPLFEGAKLRVYRNAQWFDHLSNINKGLSALFPKGLDEAVVGTLSGARWDDAAQGIKADILWDQKPQAQAFVAMLDGASEQLGGAVDKFLGLSMEISMWRRQDGSAVSIEEVHGVDVVSVPAAGGHFERIAASLTLPIEEERMKDQIIKMLLALGVAADGLDGKTETELLALLNVTHVEQKKETDRKIAELSAKINDPASGQKLATLEGMIGELKTALADQNTQRQRETAVLSATRTIEASTLPPKSKERLIAQLSALPDIAPEKVTALITTEHEYVKELTKDNKTGFSGLGQSFEVGANPAEKMEAALAVALEVKGAKSDFGAMGIRKFYQETTGDFDMRQQVDLKRTAFATLVGTTQFPYMLANVLYKKMMDAYTEAPYGEEALISDYRSATDFKNMRSGTVGGFGVFGTVTEGGTYQEVALPSEYYTDFAVAKYGGLLPITWESVINDDVGMIRRLLMLFGRAIRRTHSQYVYAFLTDNGNTYDSAALFNATALASTGGHANLLTADLATGALDSIRTAMFSQTEPGSSAKIGNRPYHLFIPIDLQTTAEQINTGQYIDFYGGKPNICKGWFGENNERIHVVPHWTDAKDFYVKGLDGAAPTIEMAYLNGNRNPELLLQDNPLVGSMFSAEKLIYKIRHIYGGAVLDWRNLHYNQVT